MFMCESECIVSGNVVKDLLAQESKQLSSREQLQLSCQLGCYALERLAI